MAAELLDAYPDGVWFVELAPVSDPALVAQAVASVVGVREAADSPLVDSIIEHLRAKVALLIFDNCEHLVQECARLVETLLRMCPRLSVLATSREPLGIAGELPYRVPSLSLPDTGMSVAGVPDLFPLSQYGAVRLFVERAAHSTRHTKLRIDREECRRDSRNMPEVGRHSIGDRVGCCACASALGRSDRGAIGRPVPPADGGSRTAMPRQQTLRAAIDWSYNPLSREECTLLRRLSIFIGRMEVLRQRRQLAWATASRRSTCSISLHD